jgi:chromosome segregation ATPase
MARDLLEVSMSSLAEGQLAFEGSTSDFQALEEKIYRAIELLKEARAQKAAAELEMVSLREALESKAAETEALRRQLDSLQRDRNEVRTRVEKLLGDVDAILEQ